MARSRRMRRSLLLGALVVASALALRPVAAAAQPLPRLPKMVWELYLPEEYNGCGVMYGLYARLTEADRAKLHAGTKIPLDSSKLTRDQAGVLAAWFNSARWGCDPPAERLEANAVRGSTIVFKCEDGVVEFCLQSPEQGIWKKLTIACAPERAEWVRDGLPLLHAWVGLRSLTPSFACADWGGGPSPPPVPPPCNWHYYALRGLYSAYANLPAGVLREVHRGTDVSLPLAGLPHRDRDAIAAGLDTMYAVHNRANGWPEETFRTPELRRRHFGIATVTFTYRRTHPDCMMGWPQGSQHLNSFPRPHRVVYLEVHRSPWAVAERVRVYRRVSTAEARERVEAYAKKNPSAYLVAMPAAVQRHLCAFVKERREWSEEWMEEIPGDPRARQRKPGAPPPPEPWP